MKQFQLNIHANFHFNRETKLEQIEKNKLILLLPEYGYFLKVWANSFAAGYFVNEING